MRAGETGCQRLGKGRQRSVPIDSDRTHPSRVDSKATSQLGIVGPARVQPEREDEEEQPEVRHGRKYACR